VEIACIVEGDGEEEAFPLILRRILEEIDPALAWSTVLHPPIRRDRGLLKQRDHVVRVVELAARQLSRDGVILMLLDADDDCPAELGPRLLGWAQSARSDIPTSVVVANREYEAWFLAAAASLSGHRGLSENAVAPTDPESIQGAKEWLRRRMPGAAPYSPMQHQASFSQRMSLAEARRAPSFEKLCRDVRRLVEALQAAKG
jgi:hypothetical protein